MAFIKALVFAGLLAVVAAQAQQDVLYGDVPKYQFQYSVADPNTGDQKSQEEVRDGDVVRGYYSLVEPDGTLRRVDYTADEEHGFQATVSKQPGAAHPVPVQAARAVVHVAQPAVQVYHAPTPVVQTYHAPITTVQSAPVIQTYHAPAPVVQTYHAPVSTAVVHAPVSTSLLHAPVVSTVPQYINNRVLAL